MAVREADQVGGQAQRLSPALCVRRPGKPFRGGQRLSWDLVHSGVGPCGGLGAGRGNERDRPEEQTGGRRVAGRQAGGTGLGDAWAAAPAVWPWEASYPSVLHCPRL